MLLLVGLVAWCSNMAPWGIISRIDRFRTRNKIVNIFVGAISVGFPGFRLCVPARLGVCMYVERFAYARQTLYCGPVDESSCLLYPNIVQKLLKRHNIS
jgi:hypothetical protein